jgi:hypothetical protein
MNESGDIVMQDAEGERRQTPMTEEAVEGVGGVALEKSTSPAEGHKPLPASIIPPNKASTAPSQDVIDRYAPGSAPHWVGASAYQTKEAGSDRAGGPFRT